MRAAGKLSVDYTESSATATKALAEADVLVLSTNRKDFDTPEFRAALMVFAGSGKGIVLLHPAVWYNWPWPEYNARLVGGGSRAHEPVGEFAINVLKEHPVTRGLPPTFMVTDELYHVALDPDGAATEVLAQTSPAKGTQQTYPSIWIVKHPTARIVAIAPGHDGRVHELPEFKRLLVNSVAWAAGGN
ncbi:MAG: ThuA domain-containing protein [Verrucomicrobiota bacterium]